MFLTALIGGGESKLVSYVVTAVALLCAVIVGLVPEFSWIVLSLILLTLAASVVLCKRYNKTGITINRVLVGLLFVFSSFMKGVDPLGTQYKIEDYLTAYGMEWMHDAALVLAVVMILAEFIVGICLVVNVLPRLATLGASILMLFFTVTTFFDASFNLVPDCGCFGTAIKMTNWQTFFKNLIIDAVLIPVIVNNKSLKNNLLNYMWQWLAAAFFMIVFIGFEVYNIRHLPVIDFMDWKVGRDMSELQFTPGVSYVTYQNNTTGETREYKSSEIPWDDAEWKDEWTWVSTRTEGGSNALGFEIVDAEGDDYTNILFETPNLYVIVAPYLDELTFIDLANCADIRDLADNQGYECVWLTSTSPEYVEKMIDEYLIVGDVYYGDELELKTMVRSNPGLMLIDNGVIKNKWSKHDFPLGD